MIVFVHKPLLTLCVVAVSPLAQRLTDKIPFTGPSPSSQHHLPPSCPFMLCRSPFLSWLRSWLIGPNLTDRRGNDRLSNSNSHIFLLTLSVSICPPHNLSLLLRLVSRSFSICQCVLKLQPQALLTQNRIVFVTYQTITIALAPKHHEMKR